MKFENIGSGDNPNDEIDLDDLLDDLTDEEWEHMSDEHSGAYDEGPLYIMECSMCGKETAHRECGICPHCEQV